MGSARRGCGGALLHAGARALRVRAGGRRADRPALGAPAYLTGPLSGALGWARAPPRSRMAAGALPGAAAHALAAGPPERRVRLGRRAGGRRARRAGRAGGIRPSAGSPTARGPRRLRRRLATGGPAPAGGPAGRPCTAAASAVSWDSMAAQAITPLPGGSTDVNNESPVTLKVTLTYPHPPGRAGSHALAGRPRRARGHRAARRAGRHKRPAARGAHAVRRGRDAAGPGRL